MKTYRVYMLKKIMVLNYYIIFFALLIAACLVVHYYIRENNLAVLSYIAVLALDGLLCYYLSVAAATHPVKVEIDESTLSVNRPDDGPAKINLSDIMEYELIGRRIAPKDILELTLADRSKLKFVCKLPWTSESDDFDDLVNYFRNRPQTEGLERVSELPTAE